MSPHPALRPEMVDRLRAVLGIDAQPQPPAPAPVGPSGPVAGAKRLAKAGVRRAIAWYVDPVAQDRADAAAEKLAAQLAERDQHMALETNLELLKGEVRALLGTVEDLGRAIAPATGIDGASARMGELRESIHALERRVRLTQASAAPAPRSGPEAAPVPPAGSSPPAPATSSFDYAGFERRFRGEPDAILAALRERYFDLLADRGPVLDIGCGRGELLQALAAEGVAGVGVDTDADMVAEAAERGVDVHRADGVAWLREQPEASFGAIVAIQVLEHLPFEAVLSLIDLARTRLRPGGVLVAETPNPASLIVLGNSYILDPTHVRPLHPSLLAFLCESAGFRDVDVRFWAPAEGYHLPTLDAHGDPSLAAVNEAFQRLNTVLFGPQDYAVVATTAPEASPPEAGALR